MESGARFYCWGQAQRAPSTRARERAAGGPRGLRVLLEGESLLNDASSITLFTIFLKKVEEYSNNIDSQSGWAVLGDVVRQTVARCRCARPHASASSHASACVPARRMLARRARAHVRLKAERRPARLAAAGPRPCAAPGARPAGRLARRGPRPRVLPAADAARRAGGRRAPDRHRVRHRHALRAALDAAPGRGHRAAGCADVRAGLPLLLHRQRARRCLGRAPKPYPNPTRKSPARSGVLLRSSAAWPCSAAACGSGWANACLEMLVQCSLWARHILRRAPGVLRRTRAGATFAECPHSPCASASPA